VANDFIDAPSAACESVAQRVDAAFAAFPGFGRRRGARCREKVGAPVS